MSVMRPLFSSRAFLRTILILFLVCVFIQFIRGIPIRTVALANDAGVVFGKQFTPLKGFIFIGSDLIADLFFVFSFLLTAIVIYRNKPDSPLITFFALLLISFAMSESDVLKRLQIGYVNGQIIMWDSLSFIPDLFKAFAFASSQTFFFIFPNGKFVPSWTKYVTILWIGLSIMLFFFPLIPFNPVYGFTWDRTPVASFLVYVFFVSIGIYVQIYRWRYSYTPTEKLQVKWVLWGAALLFIAGTSIRYIRPPSSLAPQFNTLTRVIATFPAVALTYSFSRSVKEYKLLELNPIVGRTLIWLIMTAIVVMVFVFIVGGIGGLLSVENSPILSAIATGIVAISFQPVRLQVQKQINQYLGLLDNPWDVMNKINEQQQFLSASNLLLNKTTETIAQMLKLPYLAISIGDGEQTHILAQYGTPKSEHLSFDMIYQSEVIGRLVVAPRSIGEVFNEQDKRILYAITQHVATVVQMVNYYADLQHTREQLVTTREEERRRLQHDLHDGLVPRLAASNIDIGTARSQIRTDPYSADNLLDRAETEIAASIGEIRHLIYKLRPPILDQLGLIRAIEEFVASYQTPTLNIMVNIPQELVKLSAALEVAIYMIVQEAVTNVRRHANARHCTITLTMSHDLRLEIKDDGTGSVEVSRKAGVGLNSMRNRAEELGGSFAITSGPTVGTCIVIFLPIPSPDEPSDMITLDL